jgi:hypothetical protein
LLTLQKFAALKCLFHGWSLLVPAASPAGQNAVDIVVAPYRYQLPYTELELILPAGEKRELALPGA